MTEQTENDGMMFLIIPIRFNLKHICPNLRSFKISPLEPVYISGRVRNNS